MTEPSWNMGCGHFDAYGDSSHDCSTWYADDGEPDPEPEEVMSHIKTKTCPVDGEECDTELCPDGCTSLQVMIEMRGMKIEEKDD